MTHIESKVLAWGEFIKTQSVWDDIPLIVANSWRQS
jgi:hypothetical protein